MAKKIEKYLDFFLISVTAFRRNMTKENHETLIFAFVDILQILLNESVVKLRIEITGDLLYQTLKVKKMKRMP